MHNPQENIYICPRCDFSYNGINMFIMAAQTEYKGGEFPLNMNSAQIEQAQHFILFMQEFLNKQRD